MRLNFNLLTSSSQFPKWVDRLRNDWLDYYQIESNASVTAIRNFIWSPKGTQLFVDWCKSQDYGVDYWELDYVAVTGSDPIAFGILINESCPKIVEYKLRVDHDS